MVSTLFDGPNAGETKRIDGSAFGASTVGVGVGVGVAVAVAVGVGVGVGVGEDIAAVGFVGELEGLDAVVEDFEADADAAADRDLGAGLDGAEFHLDVGSVVRGGANEALENDAELTIVAHDVLLLDAVDG